MKARSVGVALVLTLMLALAWGESAGAGTVEVRVVPDLDLADVAPTAAAGLAVPGWGDTVSRESALATVESGRLRNPHVETDCAPALQVGVPISSPAVDGEVVVLVELPPEGTTVNDRRYPIAIEGRGWHGLLRSPSTRIPGLVSLADVAPTVLGLAGQEIPACAAGRVLRAETAPAALATLEALDSRLTETREARFAAGVAGAAIVVALSVVGLLGWGLAARGAVLAIPAATTASLALALAGRSAWWVFAVATGALAVGGAGAARSRAALGLLVLGSVAFHFVALAWWGPDVSLSLLGPNPDAGGRFFGLPNELETMLVGSTVAAAALLHGRTGMAGIMVVGTIGLITIAPDRLGASTTGAVVLAVALGVLSLAIEGRRGLVPAAVVAAAAVAVLALARPEHASGAGAGRLLDRLELSARLAVDSPTSAILTFGLGLLPLVTLGILYPRLRSRLDRPEASALLALLVASPVSLLLNDSPDAVLTVFALWSVAVIAYGIAGTRGDRPEGSYRLAPVWASSHSSRSPSSPSPSWVQPAGTRRTARRRRRR
ncbi:MAG: hypothetical protein U0R69_09715 [Gaiellales bacterium]